MHLVCHDLFEFFIQHTWFLIQTCQTDLIKDGGHQYFLRALQDPQISPNHRTMAAFVLAELVKGNPHGKEACLQRNIISICLDQLDNGVAHAASRLRQWVAICLGGCFVYVLSPTFLIGSGAFQDVFGPTTTRRDGAGSATKLTSASTSCCATATPR